MDLLYFYSPGACSLSGMVVLEWLGLSYQLCRIERELRGTDAFKKVNPLGKVPVLKTQDRFITENSAILLYLAHLKPEAKLTPSIGSVPWDKLNQWLSYLASGFHVAFYPYFAPFRYIEDKALHTQIKKEAIEKIRHQMKYVNEHLAKNEWMLGSQKGVLDPYLYTMSRWANGIFKVPEEFSEVNRHQKQMEEDSALKFVLSIEKNEPTQSPSGAFKGHVELGKV